MSANYSSVLERLLGKSKIYDFAQRIVEGNHAGEYKAQVINAAPGDQVLDIGCGNATVLKHLPLVSYFGIDLNPNYIFQARKAFGQQANFQCISVDDLSFESSDKFDRILLLGVLHHLTDQQILSLMSVIKNLLSENGKLITFDGVFVSKQNPIGRILLKLDRGRYVRTQQAYHTLISSELRVTSSHIRHDFYRIPYTVLFTTSSIE